MVTTKDVHPSNLELLLTQIIMTGNDSIHIGRQILLNQRWTLACV